MDEKKKVMVKMGHAEHMSGIRSLEGLKGIIDSHLAVGMNHEKIFFLLNSALLNLTGKITVINQSGIDL